MVDENGDVWVEKGNSSSITRELNRMDQVGQIEECELICHLEEIDTLNGGRHSLPLSEKDRQFIVKNVKMECTSGERSKYWGIFEQHHDIFSRHKNDLGKCDLVQHEIHLKDKAPVYIKQFKIPEGHATAVEEQVKEWLKFGIVQPSLSRYNSPIFVVKKKDGAFLLVQDFCALNAQTYPDKYSMRDATDCIPMGLLGCPASFQRLMELIMKGIPNVLVYIDDILIHSKTHEEHRHVQTQVFKRLKLRLEKCHFTTISVEYLGFQIDTRRGVAWNRQNKSYSRLPTSRQRSESATILGIV
jgi:hypothetical protein